MVVPFFGSLAIHGQLPLFQPEIPDYQEDANVQFFSDFMQIDLEVRDSQHWTSETATIDPDLIQSGDLILAMRMDGMNQFLSFSDGAVNGHTAIALRFDGELYIIELMNTWYWQTHGTQRTRFDTWIKYADRSGYSVVHCPLNAVKRAQFNETAAQEDFFKVQGLPYGYQVCFFGPIDTPDDNYPIYMPQGFFIILFAMVERIVRSVSDLMMAAALN